MAGVDFIRCFPFFFVGFQVVIIGLYIFNATTVIPKFNTLKEYDTYAIHIYKVPHWKLITMSTVGIITAVIGSVGSLFRNYYAMIVFLLFDLAIIIILFIDGLTNAVIILITLHGFSAFLASCVLLCLKIEMNNPQSIPEHVSYHNVPQKA